jgi:hypothetical protein
MVKTFREWKKKFGEKTKQPIGAASDPPVMDTSASLGK